MSHRCASVIVVAVLTLGPGLPARADVVPPAPSNCPPGKVGVTSHRGPECVEEAPRNCAPGYRGQIRGRCVLAACSEDRNCETGERCMQVDTCQEFRELHWSGWGWSAKRPAPAGNLLAEPPGPPPPGPPKKAWVQLNICGQDGACAAPAECRPAALCYPTDKIGQTKAKVAEPGSATSDPPDPSPTGTATTDGDPPRDPPDRTPNADTVIDPEGYEPPETDAGGGCRKGCTAASTTPEDTFLGAGLWLLVGALIRRRLRQPAS